MLDHDPEGKNGPKMPLPDVVKIHEPKDEEHSNFGKPLVGKEQDVM
jgi:small subunit ribosomal protein S3e